MVPAAISLVLYGSSSQAMLEIYAIILELAVALAFAIISRVLGGGNIPPHRIKHYVVNGDTY